MKDDWGDSPTAKRLIINSNHCITPNASAAFKALRAESPASQVTDLNPFLILASLIAANKESAADQEATSLATRANATMVKRVVSDSKPLYWSILVKGRERGRARGYTYIWIQ